MPVCYIDCSEFMHNLLAQEDVSDLDLRVHLGDPVADQIPVLIDGCTVILNGHTIMDAQVLGACPGLRTIIFLGTGAASYIDMQAAERLNIEVLTIKGYGDQAVAEHAFALMLSAARRITQMDSALRRSIWEPQEGLELAGANLGIIGGGGVGKSLANMAGAFGMQVRIWNRSALPTPYAALQAELNTVLRTSDVVSLHLEYSAQTRHFMAKPQFEQMKAASILVNTARGGLIDTPALVAALKQGNTVQHAALDVYEHEPLARDDVLLTLPNVTLTAHAAFKTQAASRRLIREAIRLIRQKTATAAPTPDRRRA